MPRAAFRPMRAAACVLALPLVLAACAAPRVAVPLARTDARTAAQNDADSVAVAGVLDGFHAAAARADFDGYFGRMTPDGVFIGTDADERWTRAQFAAYVRPYFARGQGWAYTPGLRHVAVTPDGQSAYFDERLDNEAYGACRGTGVLVRTASGWKIAQYHLTIPVPNALARDVVRMIRGQQ